MTISSKNDIHQLLGGIFTRIKCILLLAALFITLVSTSVSIASEDISSLVKHVMPGVVLITTYDSSGNELSQGSGFIVSNEGDVITCYHVMRGFSKAIVTTSDDKKFEVMNVIALNKSDDLARISLSADNYNFPNLSVNTTIPEVGQEIIVIGGPLGLDKTVSQGIVSAIRNNTIQITAPISPGSSGGPVFNMNGEVVGTVSSQMKIGQNLNFAIPANLISHMQQPSLQHIMELTEPYSEVINIDTPLWKILGYKSEDDVESPTAQFYNSQCGSMFPHADRFDEAILCFDCVLKMNPSYAPAWNNKGVALYYLTRYDEALFCFNKTLELDSSLKQYWVNKGATLQKLHRGYEANTSFAKAKGLPVTHYPARDWTASILSLVYR